MKSFFYTSDGRFSGLRLGSVLYLFNATSTFIWGHAFAWGTGWLLMALGFFAMDQGEEAPRSKWQSPTYLAGFATSIVGLGFLFYWGFPRAPIVVHASTVAVFAVALLACIVGWMLRRRVPGAK
jgi:hypothetical protein